MKRLVGLVLLITLIAIPVIAEKYALLVGINDYPDEISSLKYCVADVEAFSQALVEVAGFAEKNVYLMTSRMSGRKEPTNINVIRDLDLLSKRVKPEDTFLFYFAGHGITKGEKSFLLATNSDTTTPNTLELSAIPLEKVKQILSGVQAHQLLTVIDACRNDPDSGRGEEDNLLTNEFSRGFKIQRSRDNSGRPSVSATLYACNIGERAYEWADKGHGVFSYYLLEGLKGKAANSRGEVVVTDLAEYTQREVMRWAEDFRSKKQTPWLDQSGGAKLVLVENRLGAVQAERSRLEEELAQVQRQLQQAQGANSAVSEAEARQQEAELQEKVRRAKAEEAVERQREKAAQQQGEEAEREQQQQTLRQAEAREQARREQAEVERQRQRLEAERQRLQSQQLETMDIGQILDKAKELQAKIAQVGPQVRGEVKRQIAVVPQPSPRKVSAKGEFETRAMYQHRLNKARQVDKERERRYQQEVSQTRASISSEIKARSQGYQDALSLLNRDLVLDETQVVLELGRYDAENQVFADTSLSARSSDQVESFDWELAVPLNQAKGFKQSVENGTVKIRAKVKLDADNQQAVIDLAEIEDLVQNRSYQAAMVIMSSRPKGGQVWVNGRQKGITPLKVGLGIGSHRVEVKFKGTDWFKAKDWQRVKKVEVREGASSKVNFDFGSDNAPRIVGQDGAEMVLIPAGPSTPAFYMDKFEVTNAQYRKFVQDTGHREPKYWDNLEKHPILGGKSCSEPNQPVVGVTWYDATAYAKWAGKRLPYEKEWEFAARGGLVGKRYSWGNDKSLARDYANYYETGGKDKWDGQSAPVGSFKPNGYGLYDMTANVYEWCQDWYDTDRLGFTVKVVRGQSWGGWDIHVTKSGSFRADNLDLLYQCGFRCVSGSD